MHEGIGKRPDRAGDQRERSAASALFKQATRFRQPFDEMPPQVGPGERHAVAETFGSVVDDLLLNHVDDVRSTSVSTRLDFTQPLGNDTVTVKVVTANDSDHPQRSIYVQHTSGKVVREQFRYTTDANGAVIRTDLGDVAQKVETQRQLGELKNSYEIDTPETLGKDLERRIARAGNEIENGNLEQSMRMNNLPVGMDELNGVVELIDASIVKRD